MFLSVFFFRTAFLAANGVNFLQISRKSSAIPSFKSGISFVIPISDRIRTPPHLFKLDWLLMSIVLLCIMAMGLYSLINLLERWYQKRV